MDSESIKSISDALEEQGAIISTIGSLAIGIKRRIIDAAVEAKVQRFIPSEFGVDTRTIAGTKLQTFLAEKTAITDYLKEQAQKHEWLSWTGLATASFSEWVITPLI